MYVHTRLTGEEDFRRRLPWKDERDLFLLSPPTCPTLSSCFLKRGGKKELLLEGEERKTVPSIQTPSSPPFFVHLRSAGVWETDEHSLFSGFFLSKHSVEKRGRGPVQTDRKKERGEGCLAGCTGGQHVSMFLRFFFLLVREKKKTV